MSRKNVKNNMKFRRKKGRRIRKICRFLRNFLIICIVAVGILFGVDYYQTGNVSRTMKYIEVIVEYVDAAAEEVLVPVVEFLGEKTSEFTEPAILLVKENAEDLRDAAAERIRSLGGKTAERIADFVGEIGKDGDVGRRDNIVSLTEIPEYTGSDYVTVNGNVPIFSDEEKNSSSYEYYSELDDLGRCGYAEAKLSRELMPTEERGAIGSVKPSGWKTIKYSIIDGLYLYNRCHLIGYQLAGENANEKNLITGTRYLNVTGMLPWENLIADYIEKTGDSVMYRVTPIYKGNNLVASGVQMEGESLGSEEICFNIFVFNVQPGIGIDYSNGKSWMIQ